MVAAFAGDCAECGRKIARGEWICFSRERGSRHVACVEQGGEDAAPGPAAAPRDEIARDARDAPARETAARDGAAGRPAGDAPAYSVRRGERSLFTRPPDDPERSTVQPAAAEPAAATQRPLAEVYIEQRLGERIERLIEVGRELCELLRENLAARG